MCTQREKERKDAQEELLLVQREERCRRRQNSGGCGYAVVKTTNGGKSNLDQSSLSSSLSTQAERACADGATVDFKRVFRATQTVRVWVEGRQLS